ncbi:hypothetical protein DPMN_166236 [Dreissena polymorpha]|uniref:Uncharacterized protein n=1 Tax=Dreissena polymorpha TaxID=45954 RepID=A0A9D4IVB2_DREPO|nr:hypothetical protein DPMN_166236 [Dreissena polymorpha]
MLNPNFEGRKHVSSSNAENLFIHRLSDKDSSPFMSQMRSRTPNTFWRSPYVGDNGSAGARALLLRPMMSITTPLHRQKLENGPVRSILKTNTRNESTELEDTSQEAVSKQQRPLSEPSHYHEAPNLITTGTGKGVPHGSSPRAKTAGKRVKFSSMPSKSNQIDISQNPVSVGYSTGTKVIPFKGRRLFLDKNVSTRILGYPTRTVTKWQSKNEALPSVSLNGTESNIKSQINAFIRKLKLAECERSSKLETSSGQIIEIADETSQRKTADKLRRLRSCPAVPMHPDWSEFDMDKVSQSASKHGQSEPHNQTHINGSSTPHAISDNQESGSVTLSESVSIESFESLNNEDKIVERTQTGAKIVRSKPNVCLLTKYRHITTNNLNKYGDRGLPDRVISDQLRYAGKGHNSVNFCDVRKTSQILGWLEEVNAAHQITATEDTVDQANAEQ